ncbi:MAG: CotH kinase family protein [Oligoflexales bacterium]|nr:CotH kinase family protein [Oligoflexales bacterium]
MNLARKWTVLPGLIIYFSAFAVNCAKIQIKNSSPLNDFAQSDEKMFSSDVHHISLRLHRETFQKVTLENHCRDSAPYGHVKELIFDASERLYNIGIRVRGNTSCENFRKQYRIKFDETENIFEKNSLPLNLPPETEDQRLFGQKSISLRASQNDRSGIREQLAVKVFTDLAKLRAIFDVQGALGSGAAVYRTAYTRLDVLQVDDLNQGSVEYFGLYNIAESIDNVFIESRYGKSAIDKKAKSGHLFKTNLGLATLKPESLNLNYYEPEYVNGQKYKDEDRNQALEVISQLMRQIDQVQSREDLLALFDVDNLLAYLIGVSLTGHWDSLVANANNDYLFFNANISRWQIIAWDLDNTFGSDFGRNTAHYSHYDYVKNSQLFSKLLDYFRPEFDEKINDFKENYYNDSIFSEVDRMARIVKDNSYADTFDQRQINDVKNFIKARQGAH